jgi:hypothetical protein
MGDSDSDIINRTLKESNLNLTDDFKIIDSENTHSIVDYYIDYTFLISENDKNNLVNKIRKSKKFAKVKDFDEYLEDEYQEELTNNQLIRNYKINELYVRTITFANSSRKLEIEVDTIKNIVNINDSAD